jgi:predicted Zn-dependent protease
LRDQFFELSAQLARELRAGETLLCGFSGERSDFVRFNRGRVRQAGSVEQRFLKLRLVHARRQAAATITISAGASDLDLGKATLARLRDALIDLPEDPWLFINEEPKSTESGRRGTLLPADEVVGQTVSAAGERDLVGFYAGGTIYRGFANSLGQKNWHELDSFNFDWSLHLGDRAVKAGYAGFEWDEKVFAEKVEAAAGQLSLLQKPERPIEPGEYRAYLTPRALEELIGLLSWGAFSARARATKQSPLLRMEQGEALAPTVTLTEYTRGGVGGGFQQDGFVKPESVMLIAGGKLRDALVSPRSAKEYGLATNAANAHESPESLDMAPGALKADEALRALDNGLYISNLWYLNFSDRPAGRIAGMTRFATFWVEGGRIVAPVSAMRFDDSIYRMLGTSLVDLTREREFLLDPSTYGERSTSSARLPGALLSGLRLTL